MEQILDTIRSSIVDAEHEITREKVREALESGLKPELVLNQAMVPAMEEVGRLFEEGEFFVPEMLISARAMKAGMEILKPAMVASNIKPVASVVAGTVKGDLHDIGKNLVCLMLEGSAFEIHDLGTDVSPETFVEKVKETGADMIAMSALLTTTMPSMQATIKALEDEGLRSSVKVIVGGAPLNEKYAEDIGADGFASDASRAVSLAKQLTGVI